MLPGRRMAPKRLLLLAYEAVRRSGLVDMGNAEMVAAFASHMCDVQMTAADVAEIQANYDTLIADCSDDEVEPYLLMIRMRDLDIDAEMDIEEGLWAAHFVLFRGGEPGGVPSVTSACHLTRASPALSVTKDRACNSWNCSLLLSWAGYWCLPLICGQ